MTADIGSKGLQHTQPTQHSQTINPASQDLEFSGQLNRASHQGANFALLLASLQQDVLARPHVGKGSEPSNQQVDDIQSNYPEIHLQTYAQDWPLADTTTHILHSDGIRGAQLWLAMHPQPLSLHNDPFHIDDDIYANCDSHTQTRYSQTEAEAGNEIVVDETGIFDLLEEIGLQMQA